MQERASKESLVATDVTALALDFTDKPAKLVRNQRSPKGQKLTAFKDMNVLFIFSSLTHLLLSFFKS